MTSEQHRSVVRLLESIREFIAAWEQHNALVPVTEGEAEWAARKAAAAALGILEGRAEWLETEMALEGDRYGTGNLYGTGPIFAKEDA